MLLNAVIYLQCSCLVFALFPEGLTEQTFDVVYNHATQLGLVGIFKYLRRKNNQSMKNIGKNAESELEARSHRGALLFFLSLSI